MDSRELFKDEHIIQKVLRPWVGGLWNNEVARGRGDKQSFRDTENQTLSCEYTKHKRSFIPNTIMLLVSEVYLEHFPFCPRIRTW